MKNLLIICFAFGMIIGCGDGVAGTNCPTTTACGCSAKNKSDCEIDYCCKWTVGQGCGCA